MSAATGTGFVDPYIELASEEGFIESEAYSGLPHKLRWGGISKKNEALDVEELSRVEVVLTDFRSSARSVLQADLVSSTEDIPSRIERKGHRRIVITVLGKASSNKGRSYDWLRSLPAMEKAESIKREVERIFKAAKDEVFEDGTRSNFSEALVSLVTENAQSTLKALRDLILNEKVNLEAASQALRWLGHMQHAPSHGLRLELLTQGLSSRSALVKDGAALGLSYLDDPRAIPDLQNAIEQERSMSLREDLQQVLSQLEDTARAVSFESVKQ